MANSSSDNRVIRSLSKARRMEHVSTAFWVMIIVHCPSMAAAVLLRIKRDKALDTGAHVQGAVDVHDVADEHRWPVLAVASLLMFLADGIQVRSQIDLTYE